MGVAIIKYNAGNNFSVICALKRIGVEAIVTDNPLKIAEADKVIFPEWGRRLRQWPICVNTILIG